MAALSHLGVPIYGPLLPLFLFKSRAGGRFRREHASQAFSFQCAFLLAWVVLVVLAVSGLVGWVVLPIVLAVAFVAQLPNVARAFKGEPPLQVMPLTLLRIPEPPPTPGGTTAI